MLKQTVSKQEEAEREILAVTRQLLLESGAERAISGLRLESSFERDLSLGSLERVELLLRVEAAFSLSLPDDTIAEAQTPGALARVVLQSAASQTGFSGRSQRGTGRQSAEERPEIPEIKVRPAQTLTESLLRHAQDHPDRPHIYLPSDKSETLRISYSDLLKRAASIAQGLKARGLSLGEKVAIMLPTEAAFFYTFLGVLLAGGTPVPVYPPFRPDRIEEYAERQAAILGNAGAAYLVTFQKVEGLARLLRPRLPDLRAVLLPEGLESLVLDDASSTPIVKEGDAALIQYTSGSTGSPKGVYLSHRNLIANIQGMGRALEITPREVGVSWLPLYHDMGLIGSWLFCLYHGIPITILSPLAFLSRPERWLWTIHRCRATLSPAPNFAYEICATKIRDEAIEGLDLSSWRIALNGAEPIHPETIARFTRRFAPYGFRPETLLPVYGMAEASVGLCFPKLGRPPRIDRISRQDFEAERKALPASSSEPSPLEFVGCGMALPDHAVRIVDDNGAVLGERIEGRIEFKGPSCTAGYYRNEEASASLFHDEWLVPGDLGYWADGELFITGRKKDLIIKGGRNLHPQEMEAVIGEIQGIRKGCVAAFGLPDKRLGTEKLVIIAETREKKEAARAALNALINERLGATIGLPADILCLVPPGSVPKTSSGKISRSAARKAYLERRLVRRRRSVPLQIARLAFSWLGSWGLRAVKNLGHFFYGAYLFCALTLIVIPLWVMVSIFSERNAGRILKRGARLFLCLAGCFPRIEGARYLEQKGPVIWVANHASYADACFLIAVLPAGIRFVAKQELLKVPLLKTFIQKGGHLCVDRSDVRKGASETEQLVHLLKEGHSVLIFPEGAFSAKAGLGAFKLGAFKSAAETGFPICPVSLKGTRQLLRAKRWIPERTDVRLTVSSPIMPKGEAWREVVRLRDQSRMAISRHCGEERLE